MRSFYSIAAFLALASLAFAQTVDPERSKFEIIGSIWLVDSTGTLQASGTALDLKSDLGVTQQKQTFTGKVVLKPGRRHKLLVEGTPYRLEGTQKLSRTVTYQNQNYSVSDTITSKATLDSVYGGYQFDVVSNPAGHFGFNVGGAYLNAMGALTSATTKITATKSVTIGMPMAGVEFRVFPVRKKTLFELNGEVKGMTFGSYGHFVQASANAGIGWGPVLFEAGWRVADYNIHTSNNSTSVAPRFSGPVFSVVLRIP